ncbi:hypothetical protein [Brevundimonas naejangsanensis]|uniref:hypothetical protein n=1 Tax=Brevundimonas naejangsanensis TaxID=588932 RepID=UPI0026EE992B|nr:hypothetical protein [Brevundimonas naejangsanensis]
MTALALTSFPTAPAVREGSPRRAAILTALASAAVRQGNLRAVLILARTGRPRSLIRCRGDFRWLALAGLKALYPEANIEILRAALGCRLTDKRLHEPARYAARVAAREAWPAEEVAAIAQDVAEHEDHELTARWIWPTACAVAAAQTGVDPEAVRVVTGSRASQPRGIGLARKYAVYLTMTEGDVNATAMAAATGLNKQTVRHHAMTVEDARDDDGALDATLETLAAELRRRLDEELSQW